MTTKNGFFKLEPEVAGKMPLDKMWFTLAEIMRCFGLSPEELRAELIAGRLTAEGRKTKDSYADIHIRADNVAKWIDETGHKFVV